MKENKEYSIDKWDIILSYSVAISLVMAIIVMAIFL